MIGNRLLLPLIDTVLRNADRYPLSPDIEIVTLGDHYAQRIAARPELSARYGQSVRSMKTAIVVRTDENEDLKSRNDRELMDIAILAAMSVRLATGIPLDIPFWFDVDGEEIKGYGNTRIKTFRLENRYTYPLDDGDQHNGLLALQSGYAGILESQLQNANKNVLLRALKFAAIGFETRHVDSRLVNNTIFLEALFSNAESELAFQISSRISWYLEKDSDPETRVALFNEIKKLYSYRSKVVHGASLSDKNKNLKEMLYFSEILNTRIFCLILTAGHVPIFSKKADRRDIELKNLSLGAPNAFFERNA